MLHASAAKSKRINNKQTHKTAISFQVANLVVLQWDYVLILNDATMKRWDICLEMSIKMTQKEKSNWLILVVVL